MIEATIPNKPDTQCRKCTQFFFKGSSSGMTSFCVTDGESHDWFSPTADLTAERDKYRDALAEHTSWKPDVGIIPPIPMGHGTCCCCGKCGRDHDECVCTHNEIEQFLARQVKAELEGE